MTGSGRKWQEVATKVARKVARSGLCIGNEIAANERRKVCEVLDNVDGGDEQRLEMSVEEGNLDGFQGNMWQIYKIGNDEHREED